MLVTKKQKLRFSIRSINWNATFAFNVNQTWVTTRMIALYSPNKAIHILSKWAALPRPLLNARGTLPLFPQILQRCSIYRLNISICNKLLLIWNNVILQSFDLKNILSSFSLAKISCCTTNGHLVQGEPSRCFQGCVDIKTNVVFYYSICILKWNFCFEVNTTLRTTWWVTLYCRWMSLFGNGPLLMIFCWMLSRKQSAAAQRASRRLSLKFARQQKNV